MIFLFISRISIDFSAYYLDFSMIGIPVYIEIENKMCSSNLLYVDLYFMPRFITV